MKRIAALALAGALMLGHAFAQTNPGTTPLSGSKGGTNNGYMQFTGPASSIKTFTLPNQNDTIATLGAIQTFTAAKTFTAGVIANTVAIAGCTIGSDVLCATGTSSFSHSAVLGTGSAGSVRSLTINGGTGTGGSSSVVFQRGGLSKGLVGTASAVLGNSSDDVAIQAASGGAVEIYTGGSTLGLRVNSSQLVQFGGSTSSFPALKRSSTALGVRLADDSADAPLTASLFNGLAITNNGTNTLAIAAGKTATVSNTLTFTGTDGSSVAFGAGGTAAYTTNNLSAFAATTSSQLAGVISDETGSGALVFGTSPTLTTPVLGVASATSVNKVAITAPATGATLTIPDGVTLTGPAASGTAMTLGNAETVTGAKSFNSTKLILNGSSSGATTLNAAAAAGATTLTLPAATDTLVGKATTDTLTNKTFDTAGTGNSFSINGLAATANTGTGAVARATSPTFVTPTLGAATATSINGNIWTTGTGTLTLGAGKTATVSNTLTFTGTDGSSVAFGAGGTAAYTANNLSAFAATTSAQLAGVISDETGSGALVFGTSPTVSAPIITGLADVQGSIKWSTESAPAQITADQNNYNPSSVVCATSSTLLINSDAPRNVTGMAGGVAGCLMSIVNSGSFAITLKDESASSTAGNRFGFGGDLSLGSKQGALLKYDGTNSRWRQIGGPSSSGGGSGTVTGITAGEGLSGGTITSSGTIAIADTYRQNMLLDRIYQAKSYGGYRQFISAFADGFAASDGVNAGSSSNYSVDTSGKKISPTTGTTSYANAGGTGNRTSTITTTTTFTLGAGAITTLVNGNYSDGSLFWNAQSSGYIKFDFGAGNAQVIQEITWYQSSSSTHGTFKFSGSNDDSTYTDIGSTFTLGGSTTQVITAPSANTTAYRYYRLTIVSGTTSGSPFLQEIEFKLATSIATNNMTLVTTSQTADASVSNGRVLLEIDNTATPTLNTDLTVEVTCNGGTNWASASLSSVGAGQGGRLVVETVDQACTAGTSFAARVKSLNNKLVPIYGLSLTVH